MSYLKSSNLEFTLEWILLKHADLKTQQTLRQLGLRNLPEYNTHCSGEWTILVGESIHKITSGDAEKIIRKAIKWLKKIKFKNSKLGLRITINSKGFYWQVEHGILRWRTDNYFWGVDYLIGEVRTYPDRFLLQKTLSAKCWPTRTVDRDSVEIAGELTLADGAKCFLMGIRKRDFSLLYVDEGHTVSLSLMKTNQYSL